MRLWRATGFFLAIALLVPPLLPSPGGAGTTELSALLASGEQRLREGSYGDAEAILRRATEVDPDSARAQALLGRSLALQRKFASALDPLRRARALGAADLRTLLYLGSALWETGELDAADEVYSAAVTSSGGGGLALLELGRLRLWQGRYEAAVEVLEPASRRYPGAPDVQLLAARALEGSGRPQEALDAYRRVVAAQPEHAQARYGLARLLAELGESDAAERELAIYRELYERDQERTRSHGLARAGLERAAALVARGELAEAARLLESLPATADSLAALAEVYLANEDVERGLAALERAVALEPERQDLQARLREVRLARTAPRAPKPAPKGR